LIALAADEIVMTENAVLGPVDPQLGQSPAASIVKVLERKPIAEIDDETIIQADMAEKALRQVERSVRQLIGDRMPDDKATALAATLSTGIWTHDYPITVDEARELGLPVSTDMPSVVLDLMQLYPQTTQRRPSVEYIPLPYGPRSRPAERPAGGTARIRRG
jgi:ClpP class serine protease